MPVSDRHPLSPTDISRRLTTRWCGRALHHVEKVGSTNAYALDLAVQGAEHGTTVIAETQSAGRGREGRSWYSPPYENLYLTILVKRLPTAERSSWIPLVAGLAVSRAAEVLTSRAPSLKWPNDLLLHHRKIGGVLCERASRGAHVGGVVVGIGLNVNTPADAFPESLREDASSIAAQTGRSWGRDAFVVQILQAFEVLYDELLATDGLNAIRDAYHIRCTTLGRQVRVVTTSQDTIVGEAIDLGPDGSLRIRRMPSEETSDSGRQGALVEIRSGDVFHLR